MPTRRVAIIPIDAQMECRANFLEFDKPLKCSVVPNEIPVFGWS